jgi:sugar lactone lactonase YvrE
MADEYGIRYGILGSLALAGLLAFQVPATPRRLATVEGMSIPEALSYDAAHGMYFVSNVNGNPGTKENKGFISRITADGKLDSLHFIQGGRNGVELNGPLGSRIRGDTLWVLDVDAIRAFDTRTGAPLSSIDLSAMNPQLLNDLAFMPNGDIYVTDTGWLDSATAPRAPVAYRIYRITPDRKVSVALEGKVLEGPDGIDWDPRRKVLVLAPLMGKQMQTWAPGQPAPLNLLPGPGQYDGLEVEADGRVLLTSWGDSTVNELVGSRTVRVLGPMEAAPADIAVDAKRGRFGVVLLTANRFELWTLPPKGN